MLNLLFRRNLSKLVLLTYFALIGSSVYAFEDFPSISVKELFTNTVIEDELNGWVVESLGGLVSVSQNELFRHKVDKWGHDFFARPLTKKPVKVVEHKFFSSLSNEYKNGKYIAYKYVFDPRSFITTKEARDFAHVTAVEGVEVENLEERNILDQYLEADHQEAQELASQGMGSQDASEKNVAEQYLRSLEVSKSILNTPVFFYLVKEADQITNSNDLVEVPSDEQVDKFLEDQISASKLYHQSVLGFNLNLEEKRSLLRLSAEKGLAVAQACYADMLYTGEGGEKNFVEARVHYQKAADQGMRGSQYNYARMLYHGRGGDRDIVGARRYFKLAADQGFAQAQYNYGVLLITGQGGEPDPAEARRQFKAAADQNHAEAQYNYALMVLRGQGESVDQEEAKRYLKLAADQGFVRAQSVLAQLSPQ